MYINLVWSKIWCGWIECVESERKLIPQFGVVRESVSVSE